MAPSATVKEARQAALAGQPQVALAALLLHAERGSNVASATLAELLAFLGRWGEVIPHAGRFIAEPFAVHASSVFDDMVRLLGRAGRESGRWSEVRAAAAFARQGIEQYLQRNPQGYEPEKIRSVHYRLDAVLQRLHDYALGEGSPPHELIAIFPANTALQGRRDRADRTAYEAAVAEAAHHWPDDPAVRAVAQFRLAEQYGLDDDALALHAGHYEALPFDCAVIAARMLARREQPDAAWEALQRKLSAWLPVDRVQIGPVVLLTDETLAPLMTTARCHELLQTPRGGAEA